ncbi:PA2169 family four-helix-bundle protein [Pseudoroseomonas ludipueritiae]|uniref:PA2169 family four-helix-bundle protein n=1 Tax=Pseudoroseomonas ludipueritiae TaxID=198093 RepID=A0ABR7RBI0_9PROT|nr:PA2169 family four-helix-bundle protein [Pseudoroseomonas ludipueritiae]MBC9179199.1 PA2169 family four-helix-bundle protein [Pseudoroseomonas ludipueritiae]MCG7361027.1 PA2169 family four-helix-bundle protein [Roseomonas sp. ACRSG]
MTETRTASIVTGFEKRMDPGLSTGGNGRQNSLATLSAHLHDSHRGYDAGRRQTADRFLRIEFTELAEKRAAMAEELDALLSRLGAAPQPEGSTLGNVHRVVLDLQGKLFGKGRARVLQEVVRGESTLEAAYADALAEDLPSDVRQVLKRQFRQVRATGDRYEAMLEEDEVPESGGHGLIARFDRLTKPLTSNPILSAIVVAAASALTARLLRPRR